MPVGAVREERYRAVDDRVRIDWQGNDMPQTGSSLSPGTTLAVT